MDTRISNVIKYPPSQYIIELTGIILDITFSMKQKGKNKRCSKRVLHCIYTIYAQLSLQFVVLKSFEEAQLDFQQLYLKKMQINFK